jgi:hypothetical protein
MPLLTCNTACCEHGAKLSLDGGESSVGFGEQQVVIQVTACRLAAVAVDRAHGSGTDREFEALHFTVTELDGPHDGVVGTKRNDGAAHWHPVLERAHLNGLLRAGFRTALAFPALFWFLIESLHPYGIKLHQIVRTDIHTNGVFTAFAAVAFLGVNECRHRFLPFSICSRLARTGIPDAVVKYLILVVSAQKLASLRLPLVILL